MHDLKFLFGCCQGIVAAYTAVFQIIFNYMNKVQAIWTKNGDNRLLVLFRNRFFFNICDLNRNAIIFKV